MNRLSGEQEQLRPAVLAYLQPADLVHKNDLPELLACRTQLQILDSPAFTTLSVFGLVKFVLQRAIDLVPVNLQTAGRHLLALRTEVRYPVHHFEGGLAFLELELVLELFDFFPHLQRFPTTVNALESF